MNDIMKTTKPFNKEVEIHPCSDRAQPAPSQVYYLAAEKRFIAHEAQINEIRLFLSDNVVIEDGIPLEWMQGICKILNKYHVPLPEIDDGVNGSWNNWGYDDDD